MSEDEKKKAIECLVDLQICVSNNLYIGGQLALSRDNAVRVIEALVAANLMIINSNRFKQIQEKITRFKLVEKMDPLLNFKPWWKKYPVR